MRLWDWGLNQDSFFWNESAWGSSLCFQSNYESSIFKCFLSSVDSNYLSLPWPVLVYFDLSQCTLIYLTLSWSILLYLDLSQITLTYFNLPWLISLPWPILNYLDLSQLPWLVSVDFNLSQFILTYLSLHQPTSVYLNLSHFTLAYISLPWPISVLEKY